MSKSVFFLFLVILQHSSLSGQILPKEGSSLNYRLVGFSFPRTPKATKCHIEIALGNFNAEDSFKRNLVRTAESKNNKIVAEVPQFGKQYTWRNIWEDASGNILTKSEFYHFNTSYCAEVDSNSVRLRITTPAEKYKDAYVLLDGMRAMYDMRGRPVWFLPDAARFKGPPMRQMPAVKNIVLANNGPFVPTNDLKISPQGTFTFIFFEMTYEVNYNGDILWRAPDENKLAGDDREFYHHEFTRLTNGNYLALKNGYVTTWWRWEHTSGTDSTMVLVPAEQVVIGDKQIFARKSELAIIKEFDQKGNVVWTWNSSRYFIDEDKGKELAMCIRTNKRPEQQEVHANSLYMDTKDSSIYLGFRNTSRIVKLKYPSGKVISNFGDEHFFCAQHSAHLNSKGNLYLFNNNLCNGGSMPEVLVIKKPVSDSEKPEVIWSYRCTYEATHQHDNDHGPPQFTKGGNVIELPDQSMFVNMGSGYSKLFIVDQNKKILWSALPEKYDPSTKEWENILQYKVNIVASRKDLERIIWATESAQ